MNSLLFPTKSSGKPVVHGWDDPSPQQFWDVGVLPCSFGVTHSFRGLNGFERIAGSTDAMIRHVSGGGRMARSPCDCDRYWIAQTTGRSVRGDRCFLCSSRGNLSPRPQSRHRNGLPRTIIDLYRFEAQEYPLRAIRSPKHQQLVVLQLK
jgi:hypothetical protein